jgi:hypothetical protein
MRAKQLRVVFETGELAGIGGVTLTTELTLYDDGTVTGGGVLLAGDTELAVAATGTYSETIAKQRATG